MFSEEKLLARECIGGSRADRQTKGADNEWKSWGFVGRVCWPPTLDELEHFHTADFRQTQVPLPTVQTKPRLLCSCSQLDQKLDEHS